MTKHQGNTATSANVSVMVKQPFAKMAQHFNSKPFAYEEVDYLFGIIAYKIN